MSKQIPQTAADWQKTLEICDSTELFKSYREFRNAFKLLNPGASRWDLVHTFVNITTAIFNRKDCHRVIGEFLVMVDGEKEGGVKKDSASNYCDLFRDVLLETKTKAGKELLDDDTIAAIEDVMNEFGGEDEELSDDEEIENIEAKAVIATGPVKFLDFKSRTTDNLAKAKVSNPNNQSKPETLNPPSGGIQLRRVSNFSHNEKSKFMQP